jgi:hypothetical protein
MQFSAVGGGEMLSSCASKNKSKLDDDDTEGEEQENYLQKVKYIL